MPTRMPGDRDVMRAPKGMLDVLPPESARWIELVARFAERAPAVRLRARRSRRSSSTTRCSHGSARPPTSCARRCTTSSTAAAGGSRCGPRAPRRSCARSCSTGPPTPWKVWYLAPNFRAERPQAGRYRQHWQLGVEVLGVDDPDVDVEVIALAARLLPRPRPARRAAARQLDGRRRDARAATARCCSSTGARTPTLLGDEMERAEANPLRILDSKRADWQDMLERAPQLGEYLTDESAAHFARVQEGLHALGIPFEIAPRLVRGFDYYTSTVFEFAERRARRRAERDRRRRPLRPARRGDGRPADAVDRVRHRASSACCSRATPKGVLPGARAARVDVFVVDLVGSDRRGAASLAGAARVGLAADRAYGGRSAKKQMARGRSSRARRGP